MRIESQVAEGRRLGLVVPLCLKRETANLRKERLFPVKYQQITDVKQVLCILVLDLVLASCRDWFLPLPHIPRREPNLCVVLK